jgi:hypothetical protein
VLAMKEDTKLKCCLTLWYYWTERNRIRDGEQGRDPSSLAHAIQVYMTAWCSRGPQTQHNDLLARKSWERPAADHVKVNCDAAFDPHMSSGGWGCILRDSDGDVVSVRRGRLEALLEPLQGEIIACVQGVQATIDEGVGQVIIETNAMAIYGSSCLLECL